MKVKICGITEESAAQAAVDFGADALGFVFAESKRKIDIEKAQKIVSTLPESIMKVGVFVNESLEEIERIATLVGLTHIQVHGDETPEYCRSINLPVIKAISMGIGTDLETIKHFPCDYILLDGPKGTYHGGNGLSFDWDLMQNLTLTNKKIILAGGLNPENVQEAIKKANPFMVDVSSGVETDGKKDLKKIKLFIEQANTPLARRKR
jgi:phosphoribosylanthranilate isomerase